MDLGRVHKDALVPVGASQVIKVCAFQHGHIAQHGFVHGDGRMRTVFMVYVQAAPRHGIQAVGAVGGFGEIQNGKYFTVMLNDIVDAADAVAVQVLHTAVNPAGHLMANFAGFRVVNQSCLHE